MKKTTLVISAALTAFTLLILSGVVYSVKQGRQAAAAGPQAVATQAGPELQPGFAEREAAYQDLIRQANQRLEQAQAEIQRLQAQEGQAEPKQGVSIERAAQVAASYVGQTEIYSAESITKDGLPAYRITFSSGDIVLVSAGGQVLDVQPASQALSASASPDGGRNDEDHDGEADHDEDEHDEDHESDEHEEDEHED